MKRVLWILVLLGALLAAGLIAVLVWARGALNEPYAGWAGERVDVVLESGLTAGEMFERLSERGVLRHPELLRGWLRLRGGSTALHAGEYRFDRPLTALDVLARLQTGDVVLYAVTLPEGLVLEEVAQRWAEAGFGPIEALLAAFRDPTPIEALDPEAQDLEGYLFPDTYHVPRTTSAEQIVEVMVQRFVEVTLPEIRDAAGAHAMSLREAVTLASLIEKETALPEERARISRVFHNRLERGMRLQCDPTVHYALYRAGRPVGRLSFEDLEFDSPWNTYAVRGLPPGPIANPGRASLEASVFPAAGEELYFVASPQGGHRFSTDLASHRRAVAEWRRYSRSLR